LIAERSGAPLVVLAAGGTGGHLFPAQALAIALQRRGIVVDLAVDERASQYGNKFPARDIHVIPSATLRGRDPLSLARTAVTLGYGVLCAWRLYARLKPAAVVGFGGYPTVPPLIAAVLRRIPSIVHEQNGVMGRANRLLAPRVTGIATGFPGAVDGDAQLAAKATQTGNPIRPMVMEAALSPYPELEPTGAFHLVAFGGSQGARIMSEIVPLALEMLPVALRARLSLVQQARPEDAESVRAHYARLGIKADVAPFFSDLPMRIAAAHLVVSRSGASTVAELAAIGRPAILVPLPHALDQDQLANAKMLAQAGGAILLTQDVFTPERLAAEIAGLSADPARLVAMAAAAKSVGVTDAADRLADLVLRVAGVVPAAGPAARDRGTSIGGSST
jgi:UDP-N-acetylglucosamine--N-acetylmuramyl-(pentapeptide) pyrophosphoryl-undecaprenol N-acetylglucosamine transferase